MLMPVIYFPLSVSAQQIRCRFEAPFYRQRKPSFQHSFVAGYDKGLEVLRRSLLRGIQRTRYRVHTRHSTHWRFSSRLDLRDVSAWITFNWQQYERSQQ